MLGYAFNYVENIYFDIGKNRDSNYVFGPSLPRTFFIGVKLKKQP